MQITDELVNKLAELSKLEFDATEKETVKNDLSKIMTLIEKLKEVNVDGIEPLIYMSDEKNRWRADEVSGEVSKKEALENAPAKDSDFFKVPKVIKK